MLNAKWRTEQKRETRVKWCMVYAMYWYTALFLHQDIT